MREIKFRGKVLEDGYNFRAGEFVCGSLVFEGGELKNVPIDETRYIGHLKSIGFVEVTENG